MNLDKSIQQFRNASKPYLDWNQKDKLRWKNDVITNRDKTITIHQTAFRGRQFLFPILKSSLTISGCEEGSIIETEYLDLHRRDLNQISQAIYMCEPEHAAKLLLSALSQKGSILRLCLDCTLGNGCNNRIYYERCASQAN